MLYKSVKLCFFFVFLEILAWSATKILKAGWVHDIEIH